jgi:hypothetical protein
MSKYITFVNYNNILANMLWSSELHAQTKLLGINLIVMDPCIVDYSVEIPTRCSFVIEFIIQKCFKGWKCFEQYTAHYQEL